MKQLVSLDKLFFLGVADCLVSRVGIAHHSCLRYGTFYKLFRTAGVFIKKRDLVYTFR